MDFFDEDYIIVKRGEDCPYHPGEKLGKHSHDSGFGECMISEPTICKYNEDNEFFIHTHTHDLKGLTLTPRSTDGVPEYSVKKL
ncbi:hypothetical protein [Enterovibrio nigricans]|uniref:Uncharacterized protein n=1 Tax=Enterovibrio nigricans DSM 22720 TaxID=1121868 RepID=A0A1T4V4S6_9GAMM|nr:hypothetical protein [Enterovibrio nigricans]PKF50470.1 hypothetical protein AT251_11295 [Enterovibrio nigricans]SKA59904.1 hypothetical protein SAMN02745132_03198 [Enterovibrio nigricans DSM 22720]